MKSKWIEIKHEECGKPAMLCKDQEYKQNDVAQADSFKHLNKDDYKPFEKVVCDSCGLPVWFKATNGKLLVYTDRQRLID